MRSEEICGLSKQPFACPTRDLHPEPGALASYLANHPCTYHSAHTLYSPLNPLDVHNAEPFVFSSPFFFVQAAVRRVENGHYQFYDPLIDSASHLIFCPCLISPCHSIVIIQRGRGKEEIFHTITMISARSQAGR